MNSSKPRPGRAPPLHASPLRVCAHPILPLLGPQAHLLVPDVGITFAEFVNLVVPMFQLDQLAPHPEWEKIQAATSNGAAAEEQESEWDLNKQAFTTSAVPSMGDSASLNSSNVRNPPSPTGKDVRDVSRSRSRPRSKPDVEPGDEELNLWARKHKAASRWEWVYSPFEEPQYYLMDQWLINQKEMEKDDHCEVVAIRNHKFNSLVLGSAAH